MNSFVSFIAGVFICLAILVYFGLEQLDTECKDAGGILAGATCVNPGVVIILRSK